MEDRYMENEDTEEEANEEWWQPQEETEQEETERDSDNCIEEDHPTTIQIDSPLPMETITLQPKRRGRKRLHEHEQTLGTNQHQDEAPAHDNQTMDHDNPRLIIHRSQCDNTLVHDGMTVTPNTDN